jgi:hypothetical protein
MGKDPLDGCYKSRIQITHNASDPDAAAHFMTQYVLPYLRQHPDFIDWERRDVKGFPLPHRIGPRAAQLCAGSVGGGAM